MTALRPDEKTSQYRIEQSEKLANTVKSTALGLGSAAFGAGLTSRILPFLSEFIPADLAMKGISKVSPQIGKFLKNGQDMGLGLKEGLDFLKNKMNPQQEQKQNSPIDMIKGYSPELSEFLMKHIQSGRQPQEAAAMAKMPGKFDKDVRNIEKDTGENFVDLINRLFGVQQPSPTQQPQAQQGAAQPQQSQQAAQQSQQPNQGDAALMAALDKILKM